MARLWRFERGWCTGGASDGSNHWAIEAVADRLAVTALAFLWGGHVHRWSLPSTEVLKLELGLSARASCVQLFDKFINFFWRERMFLLKMGSN